MKIIFEKLRYKNVLSYGNATTEFNFEEGIDLVVGSNGLGKSTFVDALTYGLFGRPFRKIKIGNLINNKNNKNLWVEVTFKVAENRFKVVRGMKPDLFEIYKEDDGGFSLVEKPSTNRDYQALFEESILQFGENVYRQLIALGANLSSSRNFMDLTKHEKEEVLQVITDTAIFNQIKEKVKESKLVEKTNLTEYKYKVEVQKASLDSLRMNIVAMEQQNEEFNINRDSILIELKEEEFEISDKIDKYPLLYEALGKLEREWLEMKPELDELESTLDNLLEKEQDLKAKIRKFMANEENKVVCPECSHEIKEDLPYSASELKENLTEVLDQKSSLKESIETLNSSMSVKYQKFNNKVRLEQNENALKANLESIHERTKKINTWKAVDIDYSELEELEKTFDLSKERLLIIKGDITDLMELEEMVSDKNLKGVILNQQLPFLNKYINEFLELFGSKFNFIIDNEFNEKIISRNADNDFNSLSNGQKQRISLSILFAFLKLIEEKNGISTNLLILDEYLDSSLDINGIEEVMSILDEVFSSKKDVVLISHNPDIKNRLELLNRVITVKQQEGFSSFSVEGV